MTMIAIVMAVSRDTSGTDKMDETGEAPDGVISEAFTSLAFSQL